MNYVIQEGDTLSALARRHGTTVEELARINGIANPDLILAGMTMDIPGAPMQPTTGATPRARPPSVSAQADSAPLPPANPENSAAAAMYDVGMAQPVSGDGMVDRSYTQPTGRTPTPRQYNPAAPMDYGLPIAAVQPAAITAPRPGSLTTGSMSDEYPRQGTPAPVTPVERGGDLPPAAERPVAGDGAVSRQFTQPTGRTSPADAYLAQSRGLEVALARQQADEPQRIAEQDARWQQRDAEAAAAPTPVADAMTTAAPPAPDMWQGRQGDAFRRGPQGTAPRGEMDPALTNRAAVRDAMRAFEGMTEDQLWALDRSGFDEATWDAWRRAVSAAMMDPQLRRGAGPGV